MEKYGLSPGTLKGELFSILLTQGNGGMEVLEVAKSSRVSSYRDNPERHSIEIKEKITITWLRVSFSM